MARFINVPILCNSEETASLREIGIPVNDEQYDVRQGVVNLDRVVGFYPTGDDKHVIVAYDGTEFEICMSFKELYDLALAGNATINL